MLGLIFLLEAVIETPETTVLARPSGAPYVFYKEEQQLDVEQESDQQELIADNQDQDSAQDAD